MIGALLLAMVLPETDGCVSGNDTMDAACLAQKGERADKKLNEVWPEAKAKAVAADRDLRDGYSSRRPTPSSAKDLLAAQRAWLAFREAQCALESDSVQGGSLQGVVYGQCYLRMTEERIAFLQKVLEL